MLKKQLIHWITLVLFICTIGCSGDPTVEIKVTNTLSEARPDAQIVIDRESLEENDALMNGSDFFEITDSQQNSVPYQLDDIDGDGEWDELALVYSLQAESTRSLFLRSVNSDPVPSFDDRAQVWFAKFDSTTGSYNELTSEERPQDYERDFTTPFFYQFEGPGWENDKVGFRTYFDERNAFDIWGKQTTDMVLQNVGTGNDDYHSLADWGMDILHVGNSLGAGAVGAKVDDELFRLQNTSKETFNEVADGPIRGILDLTYHNWPVGDEEYTIKERITIWAGDLGFHNEVHMAESQSFLNLIAGMVTSQLDEEPTFGEGELPFQYLMTHGLQSDNGVNLGMSIITASDNFVDYGARDFTGGSVDSTAFIEFNLPPKSKINYKFIAGWETGDPKFADRQTFEDYIISAGKRLQNPVQIQFEGN